MSQAKTVGEGHDHYHRLVRRLLLWSRLPRHGLSRRQRADGLQLEGVEDLPLQRIVLLPPRP